MKTITPLRHLEDPDAQLILERIVEMPVSRSPDGTHVGPTACDFHAAFGLGDASKINPLDAVGVLQKAVKALRADVDDLRAEMRGASEHC